MRISTKRSSIDGDISLLMIYLEHCQKQEKTFKSKLDLVAKLPQQGKVCFDNDKVFHIHNTNTLQTSNIVQSSIL